jgi:hypothetical protein
MEAEAATSLEVVPCNVTEDVIVICEVWSQAVNMSNKSSYQSKTHLLSLKHTTIFRLSRAMFVVKFVGLSHHFHGNQKQNKSQVQQDQWIQHHQLVLQ